MINVPNILTLVRFLLIGVYLLFFFNEGIDNMWSLAVFLVAGLTDVLDGYIARRYNMITKLGKLMDPLADKLMLITVLFSLHTIDFVPLSVIVVVILKELLMIAGAAFLYKNRDVVVQSNLYGKLATVLFYMAVIAIMFRFAFANYLLLAAVLATILAFIQYAYRNLRYRNSGGD